MDFWTRGLIRRSCADRLQNQFQAVSSAALSVKGGRIGLAPISQIDTSLLGIEEYLTGKSSSSQQVCPGQLDL
jgi:hypothetical protein